MREAEGRAGQREEAIGQEIRGAVSDRAPRLCVSSPSAEPDGQSARKDEIVLER